MLCTTTARVMRPKGLNFNKNRNCILRFFAIMGASPYGRTTNNIGDILAGAASPPSAASPTPSSSSPQPAAASPHRWHSHQRNRRPAAGNAGPHGGGRRWEQRRRGRCGQGRAQRRRRAALGNGAAAPDTAAHGAHRRHPQAAATPRAGGQGPPRRLGWRGGTRTRGATMHRAGGSGGCGGSWGGVGLGCNLTAHPSALYQGRSIFGPAAQAKASRPRGRHAQAAKQPSRFLFVSILAQRHPDFHLFTC